MNVDITRRIKIVFFTHYTELYGANKSLINLIEGLISIYNVEVLLIAPTSGKIIELALQKGINCDQIAFHNEVYFGKSKWSTFCKGIFKFLCNWFIVIKYASKLRDYDIIHSNSSATLIGAYFSYKLRKPHVWHIREFGWEDYKMKYYFGDRYFKYWANKADAVIAISKAIYKKRMAAASVRHKNIIFNGVIFENEIESKFSVEKEIDRLGSKVIFAIVGLISAEKNQIEAIEAFTLLQQYENNAELWIVGAGAEEYIAELKLYIVKKGIVGKIKFIGFVDNISSIYESINCLVMCSKHEALGRVTIEAMGKGITVIGYNNGGTAEIITDNYNGLLYSDGPQHLFEKMRYLFDKPSLIKEMRVNGLKTVKEHFTIERCSIAIFNLYNSIKT